jgi:hypothetical protein
MLIENMELILELGGMTLTRNPQYLFKDIGGFYCEMRAVYILVK